MPHVSRQHSRIQCTFGSAFPRVARDETTMGTKRGRKFALAPAIILLVAPALSWGDTGVGVDTWRANKLDSTGGQATEVLDPDGTSWLEPGQHRSPTGNLYGKPTDEPNLEHLSVWLFYGTFDV